MTHDPHHVLPGYSENQVLYDGCAECEQRGADVALAIGHLDSHAFARAWARAATLNRGGLEDVSHAEFPLLKALWAVQCQLESPHGWPIGQIPSMYHNRRPGPGATL